MSILKIEDLNDAENAEIIPMHHLQVYSKQESWYFYEVYKWRK